MRNEMIGAIIRRAMEYPEFRDKLIEDPRQAMSAHGFALESEDMDEIESIRARLQAHSGQDVETQLLSIAEDYGIEPRR